MVQNKDDFSALIQAFIENDERRINALLLQLYDRLEMYLIKMKTIASRSDA